MENEGQFVLVNVHEELIRSQALELMRNMEMCCCEKCYLDVCALALNRFMGHYVTSKKGEVISNAEKSAMASKVEIVVAVSRAIELVKKSPMH